MNWKKIVEIRVKCVAENLYTLFFVYKKNHKKNRKLTVNAVFLQK